MEDAFTAITNMKLRLNNAAIDGPKHAQVKVWPVHKANKMYKVLMYSHLKDGEEEDKNHNNQRSSHD